MAKWESMINPWKSINVIYHINWLKKKNHMFILIQKKHLKKSIHSWKKPYQTRNWEFSLMINNIWKKKHLTSHLMVEDESFPSIVQKQDNGICSHHCSYTCQCNKIRNERYTDRKGRTKTIPIGRWHSRTSQWTFYLFFFLKNVFWLLLFF